MKSISFHLLPLSNLLRYALLWLSWGLFLASLASPVVHIDFGFHEADTGTDWPGIVILFFPPLLTLMGSVDFFQTLNWQSLLTSILCFALTLGNFLLIILPFCSPYRLPNARMRGRYCASIAICTLCAWIIISLERKVLFGAYLWLAAYIALLVVSGFAFLETIKDHLQAK